jgi:uncharacterized protein with HEPN domain
LSFTRRDPSFLDDIVRGADHIGAISANLSLKDLTGDEVIQAAILHHLTVIGEAASRVSAALKTQHPEIPWSRIVSQRNRIVHDYFGLDWVLLLRTITESVPRLREQVSRILEAEFPADPPEDS